jgi:hypothetical protein
LTCRLARCRPPNAMTLRIKGKPGTKQPLRGRGLPASSRLTPTAGNRHEKHHHGHRPTASSHHPTRTWHETIRFPHAHGLPGRGRAVTAETPTAVVCRVGSLPSGRTQPTPHGYFAAAASHRLGMMAFTERHQNELLGGPINEYSQVVVNRSFRVRHVGVVRVKWTLSNCRPTTCSIPLPGEQASREPAVVTCAVAAKVPPATTMAARFLHPIGVQ